MAFKTQDPNQTPEERAAEFQFSQDQAFDRSAFGADVSKGERPLDVATFQVLASPMAELSSVRFLGKDQEGYVELTLRGNRSPGHEVHGDAWFALATKLAEQPGHEPRDRPGLTMTATGRFGRMVGNQWNPGDEGFRGGRAFAIASASIDMGDGTRMEIGRPLAIEARGPAKQAETAPVEVAPAAPAAEDHAAIDARVFKGKPVREVSLRLERGAFQADVSGDWTIGAANERGPMGMRLPADRAQAFQREQAPAFAAFQAAQEGMKVQSDSRGLKIQAQGAFFRHTVESGGVAREQWEFVATGFSFQHGGATHQVGRPVAVQEATKQAPISSKKQQRGEER